MRIAVLVQSMATLPPPMINHLLILQIQLILCVNVPQHLNRRYDAAVLQLAVRLQTGFLVRLRTDRHIDRIEALMQLANCNVLADIYIHVNRNASGQDCVDILLQPLSGETVGRDTVAQHTAQMWLLLIQTSTWCPISAR